MKYKRTLFIAIAMAAVALSVLSKESSFANMYSFVNPVDLLVLY